jgi:protein TonB
MSWGLTQGMVGADRATLAPSALAVGPNTYLSQNDFLRMVAIAGVVHMLIFIIVSMMPQEKVVTIPVRALSFRLGDGDRISAVGMTMNAAPVAPAAPTIKASSARETWKPSSATPPKVPAPLRPIARPALRVPPAPLPVKAPKLIPVASPSPAAVPLSAPAQRQVPVEQAVPANPPAPAAPSTEPPPPAASALPSTAPVTQNQPATTTADGPQQYVRESGAAIAELTKLGGGTGESAQVIRERYEQQISGWVGRHKMYPPEAGGREGRAIVRMRIDRTGYVRYYAIEQSSGIAAIDAAAIDMIRRANPMPAVPENYPSGALIEFLIPITFRAPQ